MIAYSKGYKYQTKLPEWVKTSIRPEEPVVSEFLSLNEDGLLCIKSGYAWDGPSGPAIDTKNFMRGSLVHDALYQLMREGKLDQFWRVAADQELRRICLEDGMSKIRAWWVYRGVRRGAGPFALPKHKRRVWLAPVVLALLFLSGCGALRTKVEWQIGDGTGTGWIQGPGSAKAHIVKPDGTVTEVEIERPPLWSMNLPDVITVKE